MRRQTVMARVGLIMAWWLDAYPLGSDTSCVCTPRGASSVCVHRASININQIVQTWYWRLLYVVIDVIMTRHAWRAWQILNYSHRRRINCKITSVLLSCVILLLITIFWKQKIFQSMYNDVKVCSNTKVISVSQSYSTEIKFREQNRLWFCLR